MLNLSHSQVHALKHGKTDQDGPVNENLAEKIHGRIDQIQDKALNALIQTMGLLTPEKIKETTKVRDITSMAKDLAGVIEKTTPKKEMHLHGPTVVVYTPKPNEEADYEIVEAPAPRG